MKPLLLKLISAFAFCCVLSLLFGLQVDAGFVLQPVQMETHWELDVESWMKVYKNSPQHAALLNLKPALTMKVYSEPKFFDVFLPPTNEAAVGEVWAFDASGVLPFLHQFHPGASIALSGKRGAFACLRALSPDYAEIIFRFHADFNLEMVENLVEIHELDAQTRGAEKFEELKAEAEKFEELEVGWAKSEEPKLEVGWAKSEEPKTEVLKAQIDESVISVQKKVQHLEDLVADESRVQNPELSELTDKLVALSATLTSLEEKFNNSLAALEEKLAELSELSDTLAQLNERLTVLEKRFDDRLTELEAALTKKLDNQLTVLEKRLDNRFSELEAVLTKKLDNQLNERLTVLKDVLTAREQKLTAYLARLTAVYFTPTYFTGRLLIDRKSIVVTAFSFGIPDSDENAMLSAFGRTVPVSVSRMELISKNISKNDLVSTDEIAWTTAITTEEAHAALQLMRPMRYKMGTVRERLVYSQIR